MSDRRGRVLLVEDNEALADNVCEILEDLEVDVTVAPTAAAALEAGGGFDLALLDVQLPDASGLELLPQLRNRAPHAEMVLMTGQGSLESAIEAVRHGAFAYLLKPFDPDALLGTAERALAQVALRRERSALSRALSASEALYRGVVESADVLIVGLDALGNVAFCNRFALETHGSEPEDVHEQPFLEICGAAEDRGIAHALARALAGESVRGRQAVLHTRAGEQRIIRWAFTPVGDEEGIAVITVGLDVTEEVDLRKRSAEAEALAAIGTLTAGLAHEIRNPLNAASLQLQLLARRAKKLPDEAAGTGILERVDVVRKELGRLTSMLGDFLGLARPQEVDREDVLMGELFREIAQLETEHCAEHGVELVHATCEKVPVIADRARVRQVIVNLIANAREAMADNGGGRIELDASPGEDGWITVAVRDDGPGLPEDHEVFEPFVTTKAAGTGLGLAIVQKIVRLHGGEISLRNRPEGGAVAEFTLPAA